MQAIFKRIGSKHKVCVIVCINLPSGTDDEDELGLGLNVEVAGGLGLSLGIDEGLIGGGVLLGVLLGIGGGELALLSTVLLGGLAGSLDGGEQLGVSGLLLLDVLGDDSCPKTTQHTSRVKDTV